MPELPEVETVVRELQQLLVGQRFEQITVARADIIHAPANRSTVKTLQQRLVESVERRAKRIIIKLDSPVRMIVHLGMTGRLFVEAANDPLLPHTHLRCGLAGGQDELRFRDPRRFGGIWLLKDGEDVPGHPLGTLGPEPLTLRLPDFRKLLQRRRPVKSLLLDQTIIAGLGNIYCDESLHVAGIHPQSQADQLNDEQTRALLHAIKRVLKHAIRHEGTTFMDYRSANGQPGSFQRYHRVYNRAGKPCKTCGTPIEGMRIIGRSTCFCPQCQTAPSL